MIDDRAKKEIRSILSAISTPVRLVLFVEKKNCRACAEQERLLRELTTLSDKLSLKVYDIVLHGDESIKYRVDKVPATVVIGGKDYGIRFYGLTAGHEFASLLNSMIMVSNNQSGLSPQLEALIRRIKKPTHIQVMATLTCPYCPRMVQAAHQFAFINDNIRSDMVEISEYPELAKKYGVVGVPKTIINEVHSFDGLKTPEALYLEVLRATDPDEYSRIVDDYRVAQGMKRTKQAETDHRYEVLIVGGGPAGMSAAVYAARKGLDAALVTKKLGGQIGYTANIDNYLGLPDFGGADMIELFRNHMEKYTISESVETVVTDIIKKEDEFVVTCEDGRIFTCLALIFSTGSEFKRLGVPGEERLIGRGIAFCATCDAPLYHDQRVAIIGGGASAFTAARDLIPFASEVHVIHHGERFRVDESLIKLVGGAKNVVFHTSTKVVSFLGEEKLSGLRLEPIKGGEPFDLAVEGVFLAIGLAPNSMPLHRLLAVNEGGEVPVNRDQSTSVKGLFAAGDVTDVSEKQVSIAVGQGALAAISAYNYLYENKLVRQIENVREAWNG